MTAKARLHGAVSNAFAMKGSGSVVLIVTSTLVLAMVGNNIASAAGALGQCVLYRFGWTVAPDPGFALRSAAEQLAFPLVCLGLLVWYLFWNGRRNARGAELHFEPPQVHRGLLAILSQFPGMRPTRFATLVQAVAALDAESVATVRDVLMDSTMGPLIAAVEHHRPALTRCWIVVSGGDKGTAGLYEDATKILQRIAPKCSFKRVLTEDAFNIKLMTEMTETVYREAASEIGADIIADFTGGTAAMSAGMVLATLNEDRDVEYLRQDQKLVEAGRALTSEEIRARKMLMSVSTSPSLIGSSLSSKS
jgi:hypothetical protein